MATARSISLDKYGDPRTWLGWIYHADYTMQSNSQSKNLIRALGHIHLCGVLHVSWQTQEGVDGQYLICLLYRDFLLLASSAKTEQVYVIQGCIGLSELRVEEIDNGRGDFARY